jgi:hypothetical protein
MIATYLPVGSIIRYGFFIGAIQGKTFLLLIIGGAHILIMIYVDYLLIK